MDLLKQLRQKAKENPKRIVFPEGGDKRVVSATKYIKRSGIAKPIIISQTGEIEGFGRMVEEFLKIRRSRKKDITREDAEKLFGKNNAYIAAMMVRLGMADGFIAGASHMTSDVARAALHCLDIDKEIGVMSGAFLVNVPNSHYGHKGNFVFADCGIVPFPKKEQLAGIAVSAARFAVKVLGVKPMVAMLSYSTKGSASTPDLNLIKEAVELAKGLEPSMEIDGELQVDSALDPQAADIKTSISGSSVAGKANVLIFPNLDSGNIAYKLVQRLAKARAVGPILLGLNKPVSDLSRACTTEDVIDAAALTCVMAQ